MTHSSKNFFYGALLAMAAALIWSGNFVIARGVAKQVPPVSLNFFRWSSASLMLLPFALKSFLRELEIFRRHWKYFVWVSLTCIVVFNTFLYIAGHHTSAINMALISTTASPAFTLLLAGIFLHEKISAARITGMVICISGIAFLIAQGSMERLLAFRFTPGDWWILSGAFFFAIYNLLAKAKPAGISSINFLFIFSSLGSLMLLPFYLWEHADAAPVVWTRSLVYVIVYLGAGTSFLAYLCWNAAIARIGASRTSLFGNLIPIFSTLEALLILQEEIKWIHLVSGGLVITGIVVSNIEAMKKEPAY